MCFQVIDLLASGTFMSKTAKTNSQPIGTKKKQNLLKNIVWIGNRKKLSFRSRGREAERALRPISKQIYKGKLVEQPEKKAIVLFN